MRPTLKRLRWPTALLVSGTSLGPWAMRGASSITQTGSRNQLRTVVMIDLGGGLGIESTELEEHDAPFGEIEPEGSFDDHSIVVSLDCQHRPDSEQQLLRQEPRRGIPLVDRVEPSSACQQPRAPQEGRHTQSCSRAPLPFLAADFCLASRSTPAPFLASTGARRSRRPATPEPGGVGGTWAPGRQPPGRRE